MRTLLVVGLVLAAAPVFADDCDFTDAAGATGATQLAEQMAEAIATSDCTGNACPPVPPPPPRSRHGSFAGGETTLGTLGEARTDGEALSAGELAAKGQAGWRGGLRACGSTDIVAGTTSRGDSAFRVAFPWPFFEALSFGGEQKWQLRPRLDDDRLYLRRPYSSTELQIGIGTVTWAHTDGGTAAVFPARMTLLQRDQARSGAVYRTWHLALYESTHADHRIELVPVTMESMYPHGIGTDQDPTPASSWVDRVDAIDLQDRVGDVSFELTAGYLFADRPLAMPFAASAAAAWGPWSLRAERTAHLAMDQSITVDNRLAAAFHDGRWRAGAFVALTPTSGAPIPQVTGGGSAGVDVALPEAVKLALDVEVARSYYARLDGDPAPTPELAGEGTIRLERRFTYNPTAR